ncbi:hypothetical protein [Xenorhabdus bharatensis]|uniref:hypothetical protein n=1 Tax=Xenorhabdus bharatensis TaxID=3136256 RepID=UPI003BF4B707
MQKTHSDIPFTPLTCPDVSGQSFNYQRQQEAEMNIAPIGVLALQYCHKQLPLAVLQSRAGFYIGTMEAGVPCSRESTEYFASREQAELALQQGRWAQRQSA